MHEQTGVFRLPLIAIVDDDRSVRNAVGRLLRSVGFRVAPFATAEDFLLAPQHHETACLIVDLCMPGMNGLELQRQLAARQRYLPIIFISAYSDANARAQALQAGAVAFLHKPFSNTVLLDTIYAALARDSGST